MSIYRNDNNIEMTNLPPVQARDPNTFINQLPSTANGQKKQAKHFGIREFYFNNEELQKDIKEIIEGIPNVITPSNVLKGLVNFLPVAVALGCIGVSYAIMGTFEGVGAIVNSVFKPAIGLIGGGVGLFLDVAKILTSWGKDMDLRYTKRGADAGSVYGEMFIHFGISEIGTSVKVIFDLGVMASLSCILFKSKKTGDALRRLADRIEYMLMDRYILSSCKSEIQLYLRAVVRNPKLDSNNKIKRLRKEFVKISKIYPPFGLQKQFTKEEILNIIYDLNLLTDVEFGDLRRSCQNLTLPMIT